MLVELPLYLVFCFVFFKKKKEEGELYTVTLTWYTGE